MQPSVKYAFWNAVYLRIWAPNSLIFFFNHEAAAYQKQAIQIATNQQKVR